ncbi:MAG TPA: GGDEF domain-containing protein [Acidimicrobiales bacterium]|nr:GGDEF domain-containing protein [Acidimicrobiales bacterium]
MRNNASISNSQNANLLVRRHSLRREWSRTFAALLILLFFGAGTTIAGVHIVISGLKNAEVHLRDEMSAISTLRAEIISHEELAHKLLSGQTIDRGVFLRQQQSIDKLFHGAAPLFPRGDASYATFELARYSWQHGLTSFGLWGSNVYLMKGNHAVDNPTYGASSDGTITLLNNLEGPVLGQLSSGISRGVKFEQILVALLVAGFVSVLSFTEYSRRRLIRKLLRPLGILLDGAMRLEAGDYEHRIEVERDDEIGELDKAFNAMADSMVDYQLSLEYRAFHDSLTGLPNRAMLLDRLAGAFGPGFDRRASRMSVLYIDIDDFKNVNDIFGHESGDGLLVQFAERLISCVRPNDLIGRLGGDEFAAVVTGDPDGVVAEKVASRILHEMRAPFVVGSTRFNVSASIGIATPRTGSIDPTEILRNADIAMYRAKRAGKDRYEVFVVGDSLTDNLTSGY